MISKEVISNLSMMRYFSIRPNNLMDNKTYYSPKEEEDNCSQEDRKTIYLWEDSKALLEELEGLKHIKTIRGESEWWEGLQWDDETTKHTFNPYLEETIM